MCLPLSTGLGLHRADSSVEAPVRVEVVLPLERIHQPRLGHGVHVHHVLPEEVDHLIATSVGSTADLPVQRQLALAELGGWRSPSPGGAPGLVVGRGASSTRGRPFRPRPSHKGKGGVSEERENPPEPFAGDAQRGRGERALWSSAVTLCRPRPAEAWDGLSASDCGLSAGLVKAKN